MLVTYYADGMLVADNVRYRKGRFSPKNRVNGRLRGGPDLVSMLCQHMPGSLASTAYPVAKTTTSASIVDVTVSTATTTVLDLYTGILSTCGQAATSFYSLGWFTLPKFPENFPSNFIPN
jgi:hypothetical protein